jgi:hypothetical protein
MLKAFLKQRASVQANALEQVQQDFTVQHQKTIAKIKQREQVQMPFHTTQLLHIQTAYYHLMGVLLVERVVVGNVSS